MSENYDPELVAEGDGDQLDAADLLSDSPTEDLLDEGYSPPERDTRNHWGETEWEERVGESLDQRLAEEEPDVWEVPSGREEDRSGRIEPVTEGVYAQDGYAFDAGIAGGAASAEEAALHTMDEDELTAFERAQDERDELELIDATEIEDEDLSEDEL